ncbi:MAG: pyridoxamine 5'-phosphate oxidase family protein, partial [Methanomicrobiales archaeon]
MDLSDCVKFAKDNPVTFIGTAEGDQPRVRAFSMWTADMSGFYYHTGTTKDIYRQLRKNPKVELCFCTAPGPAMRMMRVAGKVEFLEDESYVERLFHDRPWVKDTLKNAPAGARLAVFRVPHGEA